MHDLRRLLEEAAKYFPFPVLSVVGTLIAILVAKSREMILEWGIARSWKRLCGFAWLGLFWRRFRGLRKPADRESIALSKTTLSDPPVAEHEELANRLVQFMFETQRRAGHGAQEQEELSRIVLYTVAIIIYLSKHNDRDKG